MKTERRNGRLATRFGLALAASALLAIPAAGQERRRNDDAYESLMERLHAGMSALDELGRDDALDIVRRISRELREEQESARREQERGGERENGEVREVRRRIRTMRIGVETFLEAGDREAADRVEHAMHARELIIERVDNAKAMQVRETAPDRGELAELLAHAAELRAEWGHPDRAEALADLSQVYAEQAQRRRRAEREGRTAERERPAGLDSLERRVGILRLARAAYAEAGRRDAAEALVQAIHYGELALEHAKPDVLAEALATVPHTGNLIELLQGAGGLYREFGNADRQHAVSSLAEYYTSRARVRPRERDAGEEQEAESESEHEAEHERDIDQLEHRMEILRLARGAHARAAHRDDAEGGHRAAAEVLERFLHVAELQREGARQEALAQAFEGLSMGRVIELLQDASRVYREWGQASRAELCHELAEYYASRGRARAAESEDPDVSEQSGELQERRRERPEQGAVDRLANRVERLQEELRQVRVTLRRLAGERR